MAERGSPDSVNLRISADVLERLIASGVLCAAEVCCDSARDTACLSAICKRCCIAGLQHQLAATFFHIQNLNPYFTHRQPESVQYRVKGQLSDTAEDRGQCREQIAGQDILVACRQRDGKPQ